MINAKTGDIIAAGISGLIAAGLSYWTSRSTRTDIYDLCIAETRRINKENENEEDSEESEEA